MSKNPSDLEKLAMGTILSKCCPVLHSSHHDVQSSKDHKGEIEALLDKELDWDFNVIRLEELTEHKRPLELLGMKIFAKFNAGKHLKVDDATLRNWLICIEHNYHRSNPYHNSTHAADVMQATAYFLSFHRLGNFLTGFDQVLCLIAAVIHDVDHPGKTSPYLINVRDPLAILYNDYSVLESHHVAFAYQITLAEPNRNIFKNLDVPTYKTSRQSLIDMVLATEMAKHMEHLKKFENIFLQSLSKHDQESLGGVHQTHDKLDTPENVTLVKRMLIKVADVSNPCRPLKQCVEWSRRITEEYFGQTAAEQKQGLVLTLPMFDRDTCNIPKSQTGFVDFFVREMFESWNAFLGTRELLDHMNYNYAYWKHLDSIGEKLSVFLPGYEKSTPFQLTKPRKQSEGEAVRSGSSGSDGLRLFQSGNSISSSPSAKFIKIQKL